MAIVKYIKASLKRARNRAATRHSSPVIAWVTKGMKSVYWRGVAGLCYFVGSFFFYPSPPFIHPFNSLTLDRRGKKKNKEERGKDRSWREGWGQLIYSEAADFQKNLKWGLDSLCLCHLTLVVHSVNPTGCGNLEKATTIIYSKGSYTVKPHDSYWPLQGLCLPWHHTFREPSNTPVPL